MKRMTIFMVLALFFLSLSDTPCLAESLPARFVKIVQSLESYAIENRIELEEDESIKDVVTLGYLNAVNRLNVPFGYLDYRVKRETIEWLSILCWFPIVPPDKKKKAEKDLKKIRQALARNSYERTLASISLLPGFAVSCIGEIFPSNQMFEKYPYSAKGKELYYYLGKMGYSSENIVEELRKDRIDYKDLIASEWTEKYLK
jgi:hypothetical protein